MNSYESPEISTYGCTGGCDGCGNQGTCNGKYNIICRLIFVKRMY